MPTAEKNTQFRSEGYGTAAPLNEAQSQGNQAAAQVRALEPGLAQPPQIQANPPAPEKATPNTVALPDGTVLNLDEALFAQSQRPHESVASPIGQSQQGSVADLLDAMHSSAPAPDIAALAALARRLGV